MTYPANLDTIVVRHKIVDTGGRPLKGNSVRAVATKRIWATDGSLIPFETTARVQADGTYEFELPYVDQDGIHNKGVPFQVTEDVPGSPRHYFIAPVLAHGAGPIDATEALVEAPVGYEVKIQAGPVTDATAAQLLDHDGQFKAALTGTFATHERLVEVATGQEAALTDSAVTGALTGTGNTAKAIIDGKVGKGEIVHRLEDYAHLANGTDWTPAFQALLDHLGANGGTGTFNGAYRTTGPIVLQNAAKGFTLTGTGPESAIVYAGATSEAALVLRVVSNVTLANFEIRYAGTGERFTHGIAARGAVHCTFDRITVVGQTHAAINVFSGDGVTARNNVMRDCVNDGQGTGTNGFMYANVEDSSMENCQVYNLNLAGSPAYGLQLKNSSRNCTIRGGLVDTAKGGVVFGNDTPGAANYGHTVTGVQTRNCDRGFLASNTSNTEVDMQIDMSDRDTGPAVQIISGCDGLRVTATIDNLHPAATAVTVASSGCEVVIPRMNKYGANLVHFGADTSSIVRANVPSQHLKYTRGAGATVGLNPPNLTGTTGWRGIQALITGYTEVASVTRIRRVGDDVEMRLQVRNPTAPGTVQMLTLPEGFRPDWTVSGPLLVMAQNTPGANIQVTTAGAVTAYAATAHTGWGFADLRWKTADAWPETLPGSAL